jgi:hypothetical protein
MQYCGADSKDNGGHLVVEGHGSNIRVILGRLEASDAIIMKYPGRP